MPYSHAFPPHWPAQGLYDPAAEHEHDERPLASALALAVDAKDSYTRSHCQTVSQLCAVIAAELGLDRDRVARVRLGGLLHDVGAGRLERHLDVGTGLRHDGRVLLGAVLAARGRRAHVSCPESSREPWRVRRASMTRSGLRRR